MEMNFIVLAVFSGLFSTAIIAYIFSMVLNTSAMNKQLAAQTKLLALLAKEKGISQEELEQCFNP
jgi:hypothetical protein